MRTGAKEENKQKKMSDLLMLLVKTREWEYGSTDLPSHVYQHDSKRKANRKYTKLRPGITLSQSFIILQVALGARPSRHQKLKTWPEPSRRAPLSSGPSRDVPLPLAALYWPQLELAELQEEQGQQDSHGALVRRQCSPIVVVGCTSQRTLGTVSWSAASFRCKEKHLH